MSSVMSEAELELAQRLVAALNLEGVAAEGIDPAAALMGHGSPGLGLDSIDALEIALMVEQNYGVVLRTDDDNITRIFGSLRALSAHVQAHRKT